MKVEENNILKFFFRSFASSLSTWLSLEFPAWDLYNPEESYNNVRLFYTYKMRENKLNIFP